MEGVEVTVLNQLLELQKIVELRLQLVEESKSRYEQKGEIFGFIVDGHRGSITAYQAVLKDIKELMDNE